MSGRFSKKQIDAAIEVLSYSKLVQNWCAGEAAAYGLKLDSSEYKTFVYKKSRRYARRLLRE